MKFEIGDIIISRGDCTNIGDEFRLCMIVADRVKPSEEDVPVVSLKSGRRGHAVRLQSHFAHYPDSPYEKDGKRFIPSGEGRAVKPGEWYLSTNNQPAKKKDDTYIHHPRVILLPVPESEPKVDPFLAGTREITDEDLIRCAVDGKSLVVRCKNECCAGDGGFMEGETTFKIRHMGMGSIEFYHQGNSDHFAQMRTSMHIVPEWLVKWLIPKEDIRVVEERTKGPSWGLASNVTTITSPIEGR